MSGWGANQGFEYWFPRPSKSGEGGDDENPLVILSGGRETASTQFELYEGDDSVIDKDVSRTLNEFLPNLFEGKYEKGREPEMEWVCLLLFFG